MTSDELIARLNASHTAGDPTRDAVLALIAERDEARGHDAAIEVMLTATQGEVRELRAKLTAAETQAASWKEGCKRWHEKAEAADAKLAEATKERDDALLARDDARMDAEKYEAKLAEWIQAFGRAQAGVIPDLTVDADHPDRMATQMCERVKALREALPKCATCERPATCLGVYEDPSDDPRYGCDVCCGHGNEDGTCFRLPGAALAAGNKET